LCLIACLHNIIAQTTNAFAQITNVIASLPNSFATNTNAVARLPNSSAANKNAVAHISNPFVFQPLYNAGSTNNTVNRINAIASARKFFTRFVSVNELFTYCNSVAV
jgi:hypothetical protein